MKKLIILVLVVAIMLTTASALADIVICQNKVEIAAQMEAFARLYEEKTGVHVKVITGGGSSDYNTVLKVEMASGREPDIFVIEGPSSYELWKDKIADQTSAEWTNYTSTAYTVDNKTVGFPVEVEGYGMAYNKSILDRAGIDPATLTNFNAYKAAFEKLDSMKAELGLDMVVAMVAGTTNGMTWVTGLHNFNVYLTVGNERNDTTYIDQVLEGKVDAERFHQYCKYVDLIFKYSDQDMLLNGTQDSQLAAFANGKAAFYHQGNWMDPSLEALNPDFEIAYAPHAFLEQDTDGILVNASSWYAVNKNGNKDEALAFLNFMATSEEGANYMVNEANMVPAFTNVTLSPSSPLSKSVMEWYDAGKTYDWQQYKLWDGFGMGALGPIYELLASGAITVDDFEQMVRETVAAYGEANSIHHWYEPEYVWSSDNLHVTATRICKEDESLIETETASVIRKCISPTEDEEGIILYSAQFSNSAFSATKSISIPALKDLNVLRLPVSVSSIEEESFRGGSFQAVIIPDGCRKVEANAFSDCPNLIYVFLPGDLTDISPYAFEGSNPILESGYPTTKLGDQGDFVLRIQNALVQKGYLGSRYATGTYDNRTETAVQDFQTDHYIEATGVCNNETLKALFD